MTPNVKDVGDVLALGATTGTVFSYLPEIAALLAIIWTAIRIYEWARIRIFGAPHDEPKPFDIEQEKS